MDLALIAFGLGVGVLVGMTGIGGGSLMTPMLILVFGTAPITAIGSCSGSVNVHHGTRSGTFPMPGKNASRTARTASWPAEWVNRWRPARSPAT